MDMFFAFLRERGSKRVRLAVMYVETCAAEAARKEVQLAVKLRERWGRAPRDRLSGAGPKPLQAAVVKSRGGERWRKAQGEP